MLTDLQIENVAVIQKAHITFGDGLNILSGETGAGKSIIIDALNAVLGERTSKDVVRTGESAAKVTAFFEQVEERVNEVLSELELDAEDDGSLLISRTIGADGRTSCRVNGQSVTVSMLRRLGRELLTICGQHDSQALLQKENHLSFIDLLAEDDAQLAAYKEAFRALKAAQKELSALEQNETDKQSRLDFLRYQIDELENANITPGEREKLNEEKKRIQNRENVIASLQGARAVMEGGDEGGGLLGGLYALDHALSSLTKYDASFAPLLESAEAFRYTLEDGLSAISDALRSFEEGDCDIDEIEARLDVLYRLSKKYGATEEEMLETLQTLQAQYDAIAFADERREALQNEVKALENAVLQSGCFLSDCRKAAAKRFEAQVRRELMDLDMPDAQFEVRFLEQDAAPNGLDDVEFLISANRGQEPRALSKIASGGELSRVMLAIRCVLSDADKRQTMIFDEIDAGVSGRAANKIAQKLRQVASSSQVLCVTHLAQIAAAADRHLLIEKSADETQTYTSVIPLDGEKREQEIARMIGGSVITPATLESARELMRFALRTQGE